MCAFEKSECCLTVPFAWKIVYYTNDSVYFIRGGKIITWLKSLTRFFHVDVKTRIQIPTTAENFHLFSTKTLRFLIQLFFQRKLLCPLSKKKIRKQPQTENQIRINLIRSDLIQTDGWMVGK